MKRVECELDLVDIVNDRGFMVDGVQVMCGRCGHTVESYGRTTKSIKRCLALLREECPQGECNFYVVDEE